jgi:drug/metabolite transporter (DMT)-like permease
MKGVVYVLLAEFCFATSSVVGKFVLVDSDISGLQITFFRFLLGACFSLVAMLHSGESFKPHNSVMVALRAVFNVASAMFFFYSLKFTSVTNANMLGMTYPLWVVLFAPLLIHERFERRNILFMGVTLIGVYLIINPSFDHVNMGDIYAFLSGVTAGGAVLVLRQARKTDTVQLILFYLMTFGLIINGLLLIPIWCQPNLVQWILIIISALLGVGAQYFITEGYKYIEASKGSLISSTRVIMAGAMGIMFFSDKISIQLLGGAILILLSQYGLLRQKLKQHSRV